MITISDFKKAELKNSSSIKMISQKKGLVDDNRPTIKIKDGSPFEKIIHVKSC